LPEQRFRLYAVCARHPRDLFATVAPEPMQAGVFACRRGSDVIRIVVAADLPKNERNALLHLFSAAPDQVKYGVTGERSELSFATTLTRRCISRNCAMP